MTSAKIFAAVVLLGVTASCSKKEEPPPTPAPASNVATSAPASSLAMPAKAIASTARPNLVLITMEATRPDHLGIYDNPQAQTPTLDGMAREGLKFTKAVAVAPLTLPSHASLFTALYPPRHGVRDDAGAGLEESQTTLAEHLKTQGYATAASIGTHLLGARSGLRQGFDTYAEPKSGSRNAALVVDDAIQAVNRMANGPFFLWVQLNDPHAPYAPPPQLRTVFQGRLYDGEIAWMDVQLKRLLDDLRSRGVIDKTLIVATADHGESLGEHGEETHGVFIYDSTIKVPLIMRYPPLILPGAQFTGLVSGIDLAPTLLELMGLPPMPATQGESVVARLAGGTGPERDAVYVESLFGTRAYGWAPLRGLRAPNEKFVDAPAAELYDLARDPSETINLAPKNEKAVAETWRPSLDQALRAIGGDDANALGGAVRTPPRDPKQVITAHNDVLRAKAAIEEGRPQQAVSFLDRALAKDPGNPAAKSLLAALRAEPATGTGAAANTFAGQWNLGNALYVHGKYDESAKAFRAALALNPGSAETHYALGNVLAAKGDLGAAETEFRAAIAADPKLADGWNKLGIVLQKSDRRKEALAAYSQALAVAPDDADALFNRSKLELLEKNVPEARRDLDRLLATHKDYVAGPFLEAHVCVAEGNTAGAKDALTKFLSSPKLDPRMKAAATEMLEKLGG